jgi:hypothetical protein
LKCEFGGRAIRVEFNADNVFRGGNFSAAFLQSKRADNDSACRLGVGYRERQSGNCSDTTASSFSEKKIQ